MAGEVKQLSFSEGVETTSPTAFVALNDPTTTRGDMIRRGASAIERFAKGTIGQILRMGADDPAWAHPKGTEAALTASYTVLDSDNYEFIVATTAPSDVTFSSRASNVITFTGAHGMVTGTPITFNGAGTAPTGLTAQVVYYAIVSSSTAASFATSIANALAGTAVTLSGDGASTRTWAVGIGVRLPTAADNSGRVIEIKKAYSGLTNMVAVIPEAAGETIDADVGTTMAFIGDSITVKCNGTLWRQLGGAYQSWYQSIGAAVAPLGNDLDVATIGIVKRSGQVTADIRWSVDGTIGGTTQTVTGVIPTWARPVGSTVSTMNTTSPTDELIYQVDFGSNGDIVITPVDIDTAGDLATVGPGANRTSRCTVSYVMF